MSNKKTFSSGTWNKPEDIETFHTELSSLLESYREKISDDDIAATFIDLGLDTLLMSLGPYRSLQMANAMVYSFSKRADLFNREMLN